MRETTEPDLNRFLDAWAALVAARDPSGARRCLRVSEALGAGTAEQRGAAAAALADLGYPEAWVSPRHLGQALRQLAGRRPWGGRHLSRSPGVGGAIWYVSGAP